MGMLRETGGTLGGETSGHILTLDQTTTGDALVAALQVLSVMRRTGRSLAELAAGMTRLPQVMINVRTSRRFDPLAVPTVQDAIRWAESRLGQRGRVVLRASGTEPVIRVMIEAEEEPMARAVAEELATVVRAAAD